MNDAYIVQGTHIDKAEFPDSTNICDWEPGTGRYVSHYFDSRGVTRLYAMNFEDGIWKLLRDTADFTPLDFFQRFTGTLDATGTRMECVWEESDDGVKWELDFKLVYKKLRERCSAIYFIRINYLISNRAASALGATRYFCKLLRECVPLNE